MVPVTSRQRLPGFHSKGIVEPTLREVQLKFAVDNGELIPLSLRLIHHFGDDRAVAVEFDPCGERELIEEAELTDFCHRYYALSVKFRRSADSAGARLVVASAYWLEKLIFVGLVK